MSRIALWRGKAGREPACVARWLHRSGAGWAVGRIRCTPIAHSQPETCISPSRLRLRSYRLVDAFSDRSGDQREVGQGSRVARPGQGRRARMRLGANCSHDLQPAPGHCNTFPAHSPTPHTSAGCVGAGSNATPASACSTSALHCSVLYLQALLLLPQLLFHR
jgi:hypothetical protein